MVGAAAQDAQHVVTRLRSAPGGRDEVRCVLDTEVDVIAQQPRVEQFPHVLALVVSCGGRPGSVRQRSACGRRAAFGVQTPGGVRRADGRAPPCRSPSPVMALSDVYFFLILPSSLSTRSRSCSLVPQLRMSWM